MALVSNPFVHHFSVGVFVRLAFGEQAQDLRLVFAEVVPVIPAADVRREAVIARLFGAGAQAAFGSPRARLETLWRVVFAATWAFSEKPFVIFHRS
jgi:hypothetical protein